HALRPSRAIVFGRPTLSRPVIGALLGADDVDVIVVDPGADWTDAARRAQLVVPAADGRGAPAPARWLEAWREAAQRVSRAAGEPSWQQRAALAVWQATTAGDILVLGSSSLVRDLEQRAGSTPGRVIANRGLAGIDGTTSVAGGIALAHTRERARTGRDSRDDPTASGQDSRPPSSAQRTAGRPPGRVLADRGLAGSAGAASGAGGLALARTRARARTGRDSRDDPTASGQDSRPPSSGQRTAGRVRALMGDLTALHDLTGLIIGP